MNLRKRSFHILKQALIVLLVFFVAMQFIRPERNNGSPTGPRDISHYVQVPDTVQKILVTSCYDCHSNHTVYPWYVNINPVGLWLKNHIDDGKRAINFSDLSAFTQKKLIHRLGDISEQVHEKEMPLSSYTFIHRYAVLDSNQMKLVMEWAEAAKKLATVQGFMLPAAKN
jgi:Haem-binding domain